MKQTEYYWHTCAASCAHTFIVTIVWGKFRNKIFSEVGSVSKLNNLNKVIAELYLYKDAGIHLELWLICGLSH